MRDCNGGVTRILGIECGMKRNKWRPVILLAAMAAIASAIVFEAWMLIIPAMLLLYAEAHRYEGLQPSTGATDTFRKIPMKRRTPAPTHAAAPCDASVQNRRAQMPSIVDRMVRYHPNLPAAQLVKASVLWYVNGDGEGARCHCREILGRIQREDPLFEQVCDLYMRTYGSASNRRMPLARDIAADARRPHRPAASGARQAKIIHLSSRRPSPSAPQ